MMIFQMMISLILIMKVQLRWYALQSVSCVMWFAV